MVSHIAYYLPRLTLLALIGWTAAPASLAALELLARL